MQTYGLDTDKRYLENLKLLICVFISWKEQEGYSLANMRGVYFMSLQDNSTKK